MICKKTVLPSCWLLLSLGTLFSYSSHAADQATSQCQIEQAESGWQFLDSDCDIGEGLWGRVPTESSGSFWLQCNYSQSLPNKSLTKAINKAFSHNSYLVPDDGKYRCLIGPFQDHALAKKAQTQLSKLKIDKTFIRQTANRILVVSQPVLSPTSVLSPNNNIAKPEIPSQRASATQKSKQQEPKHQVTQAKKPAKQKVSKEVLIENRVILNSAIYSFTFNNLKYHLPMTINSSEEMPPMFIREQNQYWSKVNFAMAEGWCQRFGLRLPTIAELQYLHTHGQHFLLRHRWPIKANYWSDTINLYSGEIRTINLRSGRADDYRPLALLYTTCVADAS